MKEIDVHAIGKAIARHLRDELHLNTRYAAHYTVSASGQWNLNTGPYPCWSAQKPKHTVTRFGSSGAIKVKDNKMVTHKCIAHIQVTPGEATCIMSAIRLPDGRVVEGLACLTVDLKDPDAMQFIQGYIERCRELRNEWGVRIG